MHFVRALCDRCGLSFRVVLRGRERVVQVDRGRWARTCPMAATCAEPRMCGALRRAAQGVEPPATA